ncbi:MAG TPA: glycosyltransferase family 4 protein [Nitrospira sp.]|nr:glycosyltransferase family 4 protein [Nitrospira sp.]
MTEERSRELAEDTSMQERSVRPKIAMVAPTLGILGGQAVQAKVLADHLRADGYDVRLVPINPPFPRGAGWLKRLRYIRTVANEGLYLPTLRKLRSADVVHVASASYWSFLLAPLPAIVAARRWGKPILLNYHSGEADDHLANWGSLVHPWLKMVDKIVVPSVFLKEVFARHGYQAEVIHNIIDTRQYHYRERLPLLPEFLSVRNFEPHYGVEQTLVAFAMIQTVFPAASLTIAGQGPQEAELKHLAQALSLRNVRFVGPVDPASMPDLYDSHSIFLNSSFVDNQPLSVLEAMASGLPVVSTPVGDIPNMVEDGESGTLVPVGDPSAMAKAATLLLEQPERAALMAHRAKEMLMHYDWSKVGPAWDDTYRRLACESSSREAA